MSYYPEPDIDVIGKFKVVLDVSNCTTKNELEHVRGVDESDLAAKKFLFLWKLKLAN